MEDGQSTAKQVVSGPMPSIHSERGLAYTDDEKAPAFTDNLARQCLPSYANADPHYMVSEVSK